VRTKRSGSRDQYRHAVHLTVASEERKAFLLRVPPDLWKELEKWAADDLRSVNAQIEFLLRQAMAHRKSGPKVDAS
jgi:hypothetical protein